MRLTTINVEKFQHDGLVVDKGWTSFHYAKADALAQAAFREHVGRFVRIHPDDVCTLTKLGLALENGRVVEAKPEPSKPEPIKADTDGSAKSNGSVKGKDAAK